MAFPKNAYFSSDEQLLSKISLGLSHPARIFIAKTLCEEGPKYVQELESMMPLVQASISHHLEKMRMLDLILVEEHRLFNQYHLNSVRLKELAQVYENWFDSLGVR